MGVDVAGQDHGVADLRVLPGLRDPVAGRGIAVPRVHRHGVRGGGVVVPPSEEDLLRQDVPARVGLVGSRRPATPPAPCPAATGLGRPRPGSPCSRRRRPGPTVLPGVEHVEGREPSPADSSEQLQVRPHGTEERAAACSRSRRGTPPPVGPGRLAASTGSFGDVVGVVVVHLVVVPDDQPGRRGVREPGGPGRSCTAPAAAGSSPASRVSGPTCGRPTGPVAGALVLVVAQVQDQVGPLLGQMPVRREVAGREVRAGRERHRQRRRRRSPVGAR